MKNDEQREAMELIAKHIFDMFYKIKQVAATHAAYNPKRLAEKFGISLELAKRLPRASVTLPLIKQVLEQKGYTHHPVLQQCSREEFLIAVLDAAKDED
ncbi:MAG: hypothetical protein LRY75_16615 [Shewanella xiamenensis]|jgi:hypothetical protein|uniref:Uncharacterized protein n=2 Tax=Shewanella TaxID=22 RepID=A0AAE4Q2I0_9GAMM|nr:MULTISPECIES: hypothetical protein [Shewanella]MCD8552107.1 hypothetical protein [Shewanella xiamenensis]MCD8560396.1 hypothetical protein [Shewanella xiamenensis]MCK7657651.1 hypothetical protein [Shewanella sp. JNE4-2]MCT8858160.1 hypothetical protein [Shewanella xiamenensis]MDH0451102.1 hypothetical protein [Shewanella sp. GD04112]